MLGLFKRASKPVASDTGALGTDTLALRMPGGAFVPALCIGVWTAPGGAIERIAAGTRLPAAGQAFCFHPGPYTVEFAPFSAAPELGLQLAFVIDAPDPRVAQQRFDLYLASEGEDHLTVRGFGAIIENTVQRELAQGSLDLPPCTSAAEWNAFRAGLNRVLYQRFGIAVDDCLPMDLGEGVDYAQLLRERALAPAVADAAPVVKRALAPAVTDAQALRRLFLELPALGSALRQATLAPGQFQRHQQLLQRIDHVALAVDTMPALALSAPGRLMDEAAQAARATASEQAAAALDEAWSLIARLTPATQALLDDADRIVANLELHCATRRGAP